MAKLIPLHIHTEYSLLDGMIRVGDLVNYAMKNELPAVAITDHGVMYSAIELYEKAKEAGIKGYSTKKKAELIEALKTEEFSKEEFTENGKMLLKYFQDFHYSVLNLL